MVRLVCLELLASFCGVFTILGYKALDLLECPFADSREALCTLRHQTKHN